MSHTKDPNDLLARAERALRTSLAFVDPYEPDTISVALPKPEIQAAALRDLLKDIEASLAPTLKPDPSCITPNHMVQTVDGRWVRADEIDSYTPIKTAFTDT